MSKMLKIYRNFQKSTVSVKNRWLFSRFLTYISCIRLKIFAICLKNSQISLKNVVKNVKNLDKNFWHLPIFDSRNQNIPENLDLNILPKAVYFPENEPKSETLTGSHNLTYDIHNFKTITFSCFIFKYILVKLFQIFEYLKNIIILRNFWEFSSWVSSKEVLVVVESTFPTTLMWMSCRGAPRQWRAGAIIAMEPNTNLTQDKELNNF